MSERSSTGCDGPVVTTIVANNYLAFARVLGRSLVRHNPGARLVVLVVDEPAAEIDYESEPFDVLFAAELGLDAFRNRTFRYSILELSTSVKPALLAYLAKAHGLERVYYFDPDIEVVGSLAELDAELAASDLVVTPHVTAPLDDDRRPSERDLLRAGVYNLGFLGVSVNPATRAFLGWWDERLCHDCANRPEEGLFVDQKWIDLAPALVPRVRILRHPGYNVAYWNLAHRDVRPVGDGWEVDGRPLYFFHYSGFDPTDPERLSKHQNRFTLADRPELRPLFTAYGRQLLDSGWRETREIEYAWGRFDNGVAIPAAARAHLEEVDPEGSRWPDPFSTGGGESFLDYLNAPSPEAALELPRLAVEIRRSRPDLSAAFALDSVSGRRRYREWLLERGPSELRLAAPFVRAIERLPESVEVGGEAPSPVRPSGRAEAGGTVASRLSELDPEARLAWAEPVGSPDDRPVVTRLAIELRRHRPDICQAFAEPLGRDRLGFCRWFVTWGRWEYDLPPGVVRPTERSLPPSERLRAWIWSLRARLLYSSPRRPVPSHGSRPPVEAPRRRTRSPAVAGRVEVVGWPSVASGVGIACRATIDALGRSGLAVTATELPDPESLPATRAPEGAFSGPIVYQVNADMMPLVADYLGSQRIEDRPAAGVWYWELAHFPLTFAPSFRFVDEIWAASTFCQRAFEAISPVPVRLVPPAVLPPEAPAVEREALGGSPDDFHLLFCFDCLSVPERKNPLGLIEAMRRAVEASDRPLHLVLKIGRAERAPEVVERLQAAASGLPITVVAASWSRAEFEGVLAASDAYVGLHRSEGLGLPLIEAAYLGKPVIATDYGGSTDFLDPTTGWPVRYRLRPLGREWGPYPADAVWAEPDLDHAAERIVEVAAGGPGVGERVERARRRAESIYTPAVAAERLAKEVERLADGLGAEAEGPVAAGEGLAG